MKNGPFQKQFLSKDRLGKIFLFIWIPLMVIVISFQMVNHVISMPLPDDYQKIQTALPKLRRASQWLLVHVIYEKCSCTDALKADLLARGAQPGSEEWVLYVDGDAGVQQAFEAKGFSFLSETREGMENHYGIEAAPMLLIFSPDDRLVYGGGYFERPSVFRSQDEHILARVKRNEQVEALPLYGCAVSPRLQKLIDPLGVKL